MAPYKDSTVPVNYGPKNMITLRTYVDTDNVSFIQLFYWKRLEDCIYLLLFAVCKNEYVYHRIITMNCIQIHMVHTYVFTFIFISECQSCNNTKTTCYEEQFRIFHITLFCVM